MTEIMPPPRKYYDTVLLNRPLEDCPIYNADHIHQFGTYTIDEGKQIEDGENNGKWQYTITLKCAICEQKYDTITLIVEEKIQFKTEIVETTCEHSEWSEWVTKDATCTTPGYRTRTCTLCGHTEVQENAKALGHDWEEHAAVDVTCTQNGHSAYKTCKRDCGYTPEYYTIIAEGHNIDYCYDCNTDEYTEKCSACDYSKDVTGTLSSDKKLTVKFNAALSESVLQNKTMYDAFCEIKAKYNYASITAVIENIDNAEERLGTHILWNQTVDRFVLAEYNDKKQPQKITYYPKNVGLNYGSNISDYQTNLWDTFDENDELTPVELRLSLYWAGTDNTIKFANNTYRTELDNTTRAVSDIDLYVGFDFGEHTFNSEFNAVVTTVNAYYEVTYRTVDNVNLIINQKSPTIHHYGQLNKLQIGLPDKKGINNVPQSYQGNNAKITYHEYGCVDTVAVTNGAAKDDDKLTEIAIIAESTAKFKQTQDQIKELAKVQLTVKDGACFNAVN